MMFNTIIRKVPYARKGLLIAFLGQDGAGKSTVTDDILKWLTWKIEAKKFYLGSGDHYFSWRKRLRSRITSKSAVWKLLDAALTLGDTKALARHTRKTISKAKRYADAGGIAIFDRYPQIEYYGINDGPKIRENYLPKVKNKVLYAYIHYCAVWEEYYLKKAVKTSPDVVFKLILPPEVSIQRKPEEDIENVTKKHNIIKSLDFPKADVFTIDATEEYSEELSKIKEIIWNKIQDKNGE